MNELLKKNIINVIKSSLRNKFSNYKPETHEMPFHYRLLGRDRMALFSFIHSLNTTFGTSIFEPVAVTLGETRFKRVESQFVLGRSISTSAQNEITRIINDLSSGLLTPDKKKELDKILKLSLSEEIQTINVVRSDLLVQDDNNNVYLFDLKTAKPNISNFRDFKKTLLEWAALYYRLDKTANVSTLLAIPYNPYEPEPYQRWTMRGMIDIDKELMVANEFWDFLGGHGTYEDLLGCFEVAGLEMRAEIDSYFSRFNIQN